MKLSEIAKTINGKLVGEDLEIFNFCSDSRKCSKNSLFFALKGSKRDGHDFIQEVYKKNGCAVVKHDIPFLPYIKVDDTSKALLSLSFNKIRNSFRIGITGSCGKTTTKELVSFFLSFHGMVCKSVGNLNTDVGISLSILNGPTAPKYSVLEMGARLPGDIKLLSSTFKPHISIITCIGSSHSKYIDPLHEKASISHHTKNFVIFDGKNEHLKSLLGTKAKSARKYVSDVKYIDLNTEIRIKGKDYLLKGIWGKGQIKDLELALSLMDELNLSYDLDTLKDFNFLKGRMNVERFKDYVIIDDTYNSSIESLINAVRTAYDVAQKNVIWILAPMEEIETNNVRDILLKLQRTYLPKAILTVGKDFYPFGERYSLQKLRKLIKKNDVILVKGSRIYELEKVVEDIKS